MLRGAGILPGWMEKHERGKQTIGYNKTNFHLHLAYTLVTTLYTATNHL